jgi:dihydroxy-acid dehydratase
VDSRRYALAHQAGRRIVQMVEEDLKISRILTREAFENAIRVNAAIGGSTNAVLHLLAIAGRVGVKLDLDDFDQLGSDLPLLVDMMPSGRFLMEDFYYAGGIPAVVRELDGLIHGGALTVNGKSMRENTADAPCWNREVIRSRDNAVREHAGIAVLHGNLAPEGAVIKPSAATPRLLKHRGRAVVFESIEDLKERTDQPDLDIDENSVMVLKGAGPKGYPGMPEIGNMPLPKKLLERGITDLVRISDARMSGTAYGTVVLHVSPESAVGGPLALVRDGDLIELDVESRRLDLRVPEDELVRRRAAWKPPAPLASGGYQRLYIDHVLQAHQGADFDFLVGCRGAEVPRESH